METNGRKNGDRGDKRVEVSLSSAVREEKENVVDSSERNDGWFGPSGQNQR